MIASRPPKLFQTSLIESIIFTAVATKSRLTAIPTRLELRLATLTPFRSMVADDFDILSVTTANKTSTPARAPTIFTDSHNLSASKKVNTTIHPTNIATDVANFFMPSALRSNATPFKTFEKLFTTLAVFLRIFLIGVADFSRILPVPSNTEPTPSNGEARVSKVPDICLMKVSNPTVSAPVNIAPQSIFPTNSAHPEANPLMHSQALDINPLTPSMKPNTKFCPSDRVSFDGDSILRTSLNFESICDPSSAITWPAIDIPFRIPFTNPDIISPGTPLKPFEMDEPICSIKPTIAPQAVLRPFIIPSAISLGRFSDSFKLSIQSRIASIAVFNPEPIPSKTFEKSKIEESHLSNPTMASPIDAVTLRISTSHIPRILVSALNANFIGPPMIVETILTIVNRPSKVRFNLFTVDPSLSASVLIFLIPSENLWSAAIMLYRPSCFSSILFGGKTFCHASFIAVIDAPKPLNMFLKDSMISDLPLSVSMFSINSSIGIPSLSASFLTCFIASI